MTTTSLHPRDRLIKTAANLVHRQGWTITGINQILTEAGIPKGSFYYYFRSKEALGVAVLQHHYANLKTLMERTLLNESLTLETSLTDFVAELISGPLAEEYKFGCPAGNLASEIATQCPALLTEANRALDLYRESFASLIERGQSAGQIAQTVDASGVSHIATMLIQGALLAAKCARNTAPLESAYATISHLIFGKPVARASFLNATAGFTEQTALAS